MAKFVIVTVHGTFAEDSSIRGNKWWQKESPFCENLMNYLDTTTHRVDWVPFSWSGKNSQSERRRAARKLARALTDLHSDDVTIACMAHSHGGNVLHYALWREACSPKLNDIEAITIGTPFFGIGLDTMAGMLLNTLRTLKWVGIIGLLCLGAYAYTPIPKEAIFLTASIATAIVFFFTMPDLLQASGLPHSLNINFSEERFKKSFLYKSYAVLGMRWFVDHLVKSGNEYRQQQARIPKLFSRFDEAINGLMAVPRQSVTLASQDILFLPTVIVLTVALMFLFLLLLLLTPLTDSLPPVLKSLLPDTLSKGLVTLAGISFVSVFVSASASWLFMSKATAGMINSLFKAVFVFRAYGKDSKEQIGRVSPNPSVPSHERWRELPDAFDREMERQLASHAQRTMQIARESLGVAAATGTFSLFEAISGSISFRELVHTSYFEHNTFTEFLAWILVTKFGFPPSGTFDSIDKDRCKCWYDEIAPKV